MQIKVVHIVDSLNKVNFGIWSAALFATEFVKQKFDIKSILIVTDKETDSSEISIPVFYFDNADQKKNISFCKEQSLSTDDTIVVTHGCWLKPTKLGLKFKQLGYQWIYTPHGMLEPWSMNQKRLKKTIYFYVFEKRRASQADVIRAVSDVEKKNLTKIFKQNVITIENGVEVQQYNSKSLTDEIYLFMARLHHKKGVLPLVQAWKKSMASVSNKKLVIAGPDDGELEKIKPYLDGNAEYIGAMYGDKKRNLLNEAHYYMLPSFSEGFPTSVVEAMSYGLIPIISEGCNFPAVVELNLGYKAEPTVKSITEMLERLEGKKFDEEKSHRNYEYILNHNSVNVIGEKLYALYQSLLLQK